VTRLTLAYSDFMQPFDGRSFLFTSLLNEHYDIQLTDDFAKADLLIYSDHGTTHQKFPGRKMYFTIENMLPDYDECDFAITANIRPHDPRHYRLPYYVFAAGKPENLIKTPEFDAESILRAKSGFCSFVVTNARAPERNRFFKLLHRRKRVDSGGRAFNNIGGPISDKQAFIAKYKFAIAFENTLTPGYTTEKLLNALQAQTVPIYWGNPEIGREFNTRAFINAADFASFESLADHVLKVDADDNLYLSYLREPCFIGNRLPDTYRMDLLRDALVRFINANEPPRPRQYRQRRLRQHVYKSPLQQSLVSLRGRLESGLWRLGLRF
jgi:hypothetical protein